MVIPLAMALDAILVVVEEGVSRLDDLQQLLGMVGRERVLGTLFLRRGK